MSDVIALVLLNINVAQSVYNFELDLFSNSVLLNFYVLFV